MACTNDFSSLGDLPSHKSLACRPLPFPLPPLLAATAYQQLMGRALPAGGCVLEVTEPASGCQYKLSLQFDASAGSSYIGVRAGCWACTRLQGVS